MDDIETSIMAFTVGYNTNTTHIATTSDHSNSTSVEFDELTDLTSAQVNFDCIVDLDKRIWVSNPIIPISILPKLDPTAERCGRTYVLASCVTKYGIPPLPSCTLFTLPSLYSASSAVIRWTAKRPLVS